MFHHILWIPRKPMDVLKEYEKIRFFFVRMCIYYSQLFQLAESFNCVCRNYSVNRDDEQNRQIKENVDNLCSNNTLKMNKQKVYQQIARSMLTILLIKYMAI